MEKKTTKENEETKKELRNDQGQIFISYLIRHHVESIMPKTMQIFIFFFLYLFELASANVFSLSQMIILGLPFDLLSLR